MKFNIQCRKHLGQASILPQTDIGLGVYEQFELSGGNSLVLVGNWGYLDGIFSCFKI